MNWLPDVAVERTSMAGRATGQEIDKVPPEADVLPRVPVRGRSPGSRSTRAKSAITQQRLRRATARLLAQKSLRELKVADITTLAAVAPATFYIYFADVYEAVLAVIEDAYREQPDFAAMIDSFDQRTLAADVRAYVKAYLAYWDDHYAVLRVRNLTADEGDPRFRAARARALGPALRAMSEKIAAFRGGSMGAVRPMALATVLAGAMERLAPNVHVRQADRDMSRRKLVDAVVLLFSVMLGPA
jgi:AcrR family transcriptional regulator